MLRDGQARSLHRFDTKWVQTRRHVSCAAWEDGGLMFK